MRIHKFIVLIFALLIFLSGCSYDGFLSYGLFLEKYNDSMQNEDLWLDSDTALVHKDSSDCTYYFFFPASGDNEYMLSLTEKSGKEIVRVGMCIVSEIDPDIDIVSSLFSSSLSVLKNVDKAYADKVFSELKLNEKSTYKTTANIKKELDGFTVELIVNEVGCGIYFY